MAKRYQKLVSFLLIVFLVIVMGTVGCSPQQEVTEQPQQGSDEKPAAEQPADEPKIVLNAVSFLQPTTRQGQWFMHVIDTVHAEMGDKIEFNYLGGPDVIPGYEQTEALDKNTVDFAQISFSWLQDRYSEAQLSGLIADLSPADQRRLGVNDYFNEGLSASNTNIVFLGMCGIGYPITLYTNFEVEKIEDLRGKMVRISPLHQIAAESLGMETMTTSPAELYSAVERKVVDAYYWPAFLSDYGLEEVTINRLYPGFGGSDASLLINRKVWDKMSKEVQEQFQETINKAFDDYYNNIMAQEVEKEEKILEEHGIKTVVLPDEFRNIQIEGYRQMAIREFGPRGEEFFNKFF